MDRVFWVATAERALKTFAQTLVALLVVGGDVVNVLEADWLNLLGVSMGAAVVSVLMSVGGAKLIGPAGSPSWVEDPGSR